MEIFLIWIIGSFVAGAVGAGKRIGFFGAFFLSLILSPLIGIIVAATSKSNETEEYERTMIENQKERIKEIKTLNKNTVADELFKLKKLLDEGVITEEEFKNQKSKLLN